MKTFKYPVGHEAGRTLTVGELKGVLDQFSDDMPVMATWEGVFAYMEHHSLEIVDKGCPEDAAQCLVFDVEHY